MQPPAELQMLSGVIDAQPPNVRELSQNALVMLIENGKAEIVEQKTIDARKWLFVRTSVGELFSVVMPDVSKELLLGMMEMAREMLRSGAEDPVG